MAIISLTTTTALTHGDGVNDWLLTAVYLKGVKHRKSRKNQETDNTLIGNAGVRANNDWQKKVGDGDRHKASKMDIQVVELVRR